MAYLSVVFTVTRIYFQPIDKNGNFKLCEPLMAYCDLNGNILDCPHNGPLKFDSSKHQLYDAATNTPTPEVLVKAAKKLGCTKAAIFQNRVVTARSAPFDRDACLDFYKCLFFSDQKDVLQTIFQCFEPVHF